MDGCTHYTHTDLGTQATGTSEYDNAPPDLTQLEMVDEGNEGGEEDLARQFLHPWDNQLIAVYGDTIHRNNGHHLDGGIADDSIWQRR